MIYEGTEKRLEIIVSDAIGSLRDYSRDFWSALVAKAGADIISHMANENCDAYLLSESSLFVFKHKFIMITCGKTNLAHSAIAFLETIAPEDMRFFLFKRKNENFPQLQPYSFHDDCEKLQPYVNGKVLYIGEQQEPLLSLFVAHNNYSPHKDEKNLEIIMWDLPADTRRDLHTNGYDFSFLKKYFPQFKINDHRFLPMGYSFNAIFGDNYYTIHVTPEHPGSYVSFETNYNMASELKNELVMCLISAFKPKKFDYIMIDCTSGNGNGITIKNYNLIQIIQQHIISSYGVKLFQYES